MPKRALADYLFAEKAGKSKFGSYTGTGSPGNAITGLGFRPKAVMIKVTTATADWFFIYNDGAGTWNVSPNTTGARNDYSGVVSLDADGFTINNTGTGLNTTLNTYIYAAWG